MKGHIYINKKKLNHFADYLYIILRFLIKCELFTYKQESLETQHIKESPLCGDEEKTMLRQMMPIRASL